MNATRSAVRSITTSMIALALWSCTSDPAAPAVATQMVLVVAPSAAAQAGIAFPQQPRVRLEDAAGNPVAQAGVPVTVEVYAGSGSLGGGPLTVQTNASGVAEFTALTITGSIGTRTLRFTASPSIEPLLSGEIVVAAGPAAALTITAQPPQFAQSGLALTQQPALQFRDASGNPVSQALVPVTAAIDSGGGTLAGAATVSSDAAGRVVFTNLTVNGISGAVKLRFDATVNSQTVTAESQVITVSIDWASGVAMPTPRSGLGVGDVGGTLYFVGGLNGIDYDANTLEAFNPATNAWTTRAPMPTARNSLGAGVVNGILYAIGGAAFTILNSVEAYDPATNVWAVRAAMPTPRLGLAVGVVNGLLYAVGGTGATFVPLATVEAYDPATNLWTSRAPMPTARGGAAVAVVDGILYAVGGANALGELATVEAYDPATNVWTAREPMPTPRQSHATAVVNGVLYAIGGFRAGEFLATVEAYDPATNTWSVREPMPRPRAALAAEVSNGAVYAVGGTDRNGALGRVEVYAPR